MQSIDCLRKVEKFCFLGLVEIYRTLLLFKATMTLFPYSFLVVNIHTMISAMSIESASQVTYLLSFLTQACIFMRYIGFLTSCVAILLM